MVNWHDQFNEVGDTERLIDLLNDHLADWTPGELGKVPAGCRPTRIRGPEDITFWLERLTIEYCEAQAQTSSQHRRMLAVFIAAEDRLKQFNRSMRALRRQPGQQEAELRPRGG